MNVCLLFCLSRVVGQPRRLTWVMLWVHAGVMTIARKLDLNFFFFFICPSGMPTAFAAASSTMSNSSVNKFFRFSLIPSCRDSSICSKAWIFSTAKSQWSIVTGTRYSTSYLLSSTWTAMIGQCVTACIQAVVLCETY